MLYLTDFFTASGRLNLNNVAKSSAEPNSFELCRDAVKNVQWTLVSRRNVAKSSAEVHLPDVLYGHLAYVRDLAQPSVALGQRPLRAPAARAARHRAARPPRPHRLLPRHHPAAPQRHPPSGETVAVSDRRLSSPFIYKDPTLQPAKCGV